MVETAPANSERCIRSGFKLGHTGPHNSRTMMLPEISRCLDLLSPEADRNDYRAAIVGRNILEKSTESTRKECFRRLRELYALEPAVPLFRIYRLLDAADNQSRPILSLLLAGARDPLLHATIPVILGAEEGAVVGAGDLDDSLERAFPGRMKDAVRAATARHIASTWTQSGHLSGRTRKTRAAPPWFEVMRLKKRP